MGWPIADTTSKRYLTMARAWFAGMSRSAQRGPTRSRSDDRSDRGLIMGEPTSHELPRPLARRSWQCHFIRLAPVAIGAYRTASHGAFTEVGEAWVDWRLCCCSACCP